MALRRPCDAGDGTEAPGFSIKEALALLQLTDIKPTSFWLAMSLEAPRGAVDAHRFFCCKAAGDILSVVPHTCGVERAGKGYSLVMTPLRKKMQPERARKCVYTLQNYPLLDMKQQSGDGYEDFLDGLLTAEDLAAAQAKEHGGLRRGTRIIEDAPAARDSDESEEDENPLETIRWAVPSGFLVAAQPAMQDRP